MSRRVLAILSACALSCAGASAAHAGTLDWSSGVPIDNLRPEGLPYWTTAASCPSTMFCVVGDEEGNLYTSTNPAGGALTWSAAEVGTGRIWDVSCPTTSFCAATDEGDHVLTTTDPQSGDWVVTSLGTPRPRQIDCPSVALCVVVAHDGDRVITSTQPSAGATAW